MGDGEKRKRLGMRVPQRVGAATPMAKARKARQSRLYLQIEAASGMAEVRRTLVSPLRLD
jgi:hypothetical protein